MNKTTNYLEQAAQAETWACAQNKVTKLRELAEKHKVTLTMPIHDEMIVDGDPENVRAFAAEWTTFIGEELLKK